MVAEHGFVLTYFMSLQFMSPQTNGQWKEHFFLLCLEAILEKSVILMAIILNGKNHCAT